MIRFRDYRHDEDSLDVNEVYPDGSETSLLHAVMATLIPHYLAYDHNPPDDSRVFFDKIGETAFSLHHVSLVVRVDFRDLLNTLRDVRWRLLEENKAIWASKEKGIPDWERKAMANKNNVRIERTQMTTNRLQFLLDLQDPYTDVEDADHRRGKRFIATTILLLTVGIAASTALGIYTSGELANINSRADDLNHVVLGALNKTDYNAIRNDNLNCSGMRLRPLLDGLILIPVGKSACPSFAESESESPIRK